MAGIRDDVRTEQEETLEIEMNAFIASKEKTAEESFQLTVRERKDADPSFDSKMESMTISEYLAEFKLPEGQRELQLR